MIKCKMPEAFCQGMTRHLEADHILKAFKLHNKITSITHTANGETAITYVLMLLFA